MEARRPSLRDEAGFSLVEVLVAAAIMLVGLTATMGLVDGANDATASTRAREQSTSLQREVVEAARAISYDLLTPNAMVGQIQARPALGDASLGEPGWTVRRRDETYTVSVGVCAVDDPRDGLGPREAGTFCRTGAGGTPAAQCQSWLQAMVDGGSPSGAALGDCGIDANHDGTVDDLTSPTATTCVGSSCGAEVDTVPTDYKRIVSLVRWDDDGVARWNLQTTTVNNPGLAAAPAVTALTVPGDTVTSGTSLTFSALAVPTPSTVGFYVDGTPSGTATSATGTGWRWTWELGTSSSAGTQPVPGEVVDGAYVVTAKAFDQYGQFGASRAQTVTVNRRTPFAPLHVEAGRNGSGVDVEWTAGRERDLEGYRAYRRVPGGSWEQACALTTRTRCRDEGPPAGQLEISVVAVDRDAAGALREGDRSGVAVVRTTNAPPPAPATLSASLSGGNVVLAWPAPGPDPDAGDQIDHFNIYRDGKLYDDRYDRTATGTQLTYTDTRTGGTQHEYYVTAVDTQLAESPILGPVVR